MRPSAFTAVLLVACGGASRAPEPAPPLVLPPMDDARAWPDAGTVAVAPVDASAPTTSSASSACAAPCTGTLGGAVVTAVSDAIRRTRRCYDLELTRALTFEAHVRIQLTVGRDGSVCGAGFERPTGRPAFDACVKTVLEATHVPPPTGGCVEVQNVVHFVPQP